VKIAALVLLVLTSWIPGFTTSYASSPARTSQSSFRIYLPKWLPKGFRQIYDPEIQIQDAVANGRFLKRWYGVSRRWVSFLEGSKGCCLDGVPSHRVGATRLSRGRIAYFSNQGKQFGGLYLFWDQGHTYIAIHSPNLSKSTLVRIAESTAPTTMLHRA